MAVSITCILLLAGCNLPGREPTPTTDLEAQQTQAAQTVAAQLTDESPLETVEPTEISKTPQETPTSSLTSTPSVTPTPSLTKTIEAIETVPPRPDYQVILDDDFSSGTGWYEMEGDNFGFLYTDDGYKIYVNLLKAAIWSIRDIEHEDIRLQADAVQVAGSDDGYYGVTCRHQDDENYYAFVISNNSQYGIARMQNGIFDFIIEGYAPSGVINPDAENQITADCIDSSLILYANNVKLAEISDDSFASGVYGLIAGTRLQEGFEAEFHRITASVPYGNLSSTG
jgi:hypothetical protein